MTPPTRPRPTKKRRMRRQLHCPTSTTTTRAATPT
jgi:hypothetical protein